MKRKKILSTVKEKKLTPGNKDKNTTFLYEAMQARKRGNIS